METYNRIIEIIDANLIFCLIPIILTLMLVELFFNARFETRKALNLIRWTIIIYSLTTLIFYVIGLATNKDEYALLNRATGPYAWAYWIMLLSSMILPLLLLVKKIGTNFWYVLLVAFCMKIGSYFERFVIITTSFHRVYIPDGGNTEFRDSISYAIEIVIMQGMVIAILTLGVFEMLKKKKKLCITAHLQ